MPEIHPVIDDKLFTDENKGLAVPRRRRSIGQYALQISNLDDDDPPPPYVNGAVPRTENFNLNVLTITDRPKMPEIKVVCALVGINPVNTPIVWRLQTRYVVGRYQKVSGGLEPHYRSRVLSLDDTWTGTAKSVQFTLFADNPDANLTYDNNPSIRVAGGHAILTVAAEAPGGAGWLQDYVHLRIGGKNPSVQTVTQYVANTLSGRDPNIVHMANAVFVHENFMKQFDPDYRTHTNYNGVLFDWPHDAANFPSVAFDYGIGIGQFTHPSEETGPICWDWRENVKAGVNELLDDLKDTFAHSPSWIAWARRAWAEYNTGSAANDHGAYANALAALPDGQQVSNDPMPQGFNVNAATARILMQGAPPAPRDWPVPALIA